MIKKKLKIVHIEDYFNPTAGYQINELIKYNEYLEHTIICSYDMTPFYKQYSAEEDKACEGKYNIQIIRLKTRIKFSHRLWLKSWLKTVENLKPDILLMHGIGDFKDFILYRKKRNYLVFRDCHMSWTASKNKFASIYFKIFSIFFAKRINSTNKYEKVYALGVEEKQYLKKLGLKEDKIDMMPHGYDPNLFYYSQADRNSLRSHLNISEDEIIVSYIGKFDYSKRPDLIFDCINKIDANSLKEKKTVFLFVGGQEQEYMAKIFIPKMEETALTHKIIIKPAVSVEELRAYYCASDICFWPKETTLSSIHAQACGTTVIMEAQESNTERVINTENLYNIGDLNDAAIKLKSCLNNIKPENADIINKNKIRDNSIQLSTLIEKWKMSIN